MNFVCIVFELGDKMLTLLSMENLKVQCNPMVKPLFSSFRMITAKFLMSKNLGTLRLSTR